MEEQRNIVQDYNQLLLTKNIIQEKIDDLELQINSIGAKPYDAIGGGGLSLSRAAKIAKLTDLKDQYEKIQLDITSKLTLIINGMDKVKNKGEIYFNILHYKVVDQMTYEEISVLVQYSYRQTRRLAKKAYGYLMEEMAQ